MRAHYLLNWVFISVVSFGFMTFALPAFAQERNRDVVQVAQADQGSAQSEQPKSTHKKKKLHKASAQEAASVTEADSAKPEASAAADAPKDEQPKPKKSHMRSSRAKPASAQDQADQPQTETAQPDPSSAEPAAAAPAKEEPKKSERGKNKPQKAENKSSLEARHQECLAFIQRHGLTCDPWVTPTCGYDLGFFRPLACVAP